MNKTLFCILSMTTLLAFMAGCNQGTTERPSSTSASTPDVSPENPPSESSPDQPPRSTTPACYLKKCFTTVSMNNIDNREGDYTYPDADEFGNELMRPQYTAPLFILDLARVSPSTQLSKNFKLSDFMTEAKGRYGLFASDVLTHLQQMRDYLARAIRITSGYRSPGYNSRIDGSARWSRHTYGDAVDFNVPGLKIADLTALCQRFSASFTLTYEYHIHCDWRRARRDPAYYGVSKDLPYKTEPISVADLMAENSQIQHETKDDWRLIKVRVPNAEEDENEGTPTHNWLITLPTGAQITSAQPTVQIPKLNGEHTIHVTVGGSVMIEKVFIW